MGDREDTVGGCISAVVLVVVLILGFACIIGAVHTAAYVECANYGLVIGAKSHYEMLGGCFLEMGNGEWVPLDKYLYIDMAQPH